MGISKLPLLFNFEKEWTHEFKQHDCEEPQPAQAVTAQHST